MTFELQKVSDYNIGNSYVIKEGPIAGVEIKQPFYSTRIGGNFAQADRTVCTRLEMDFYQTDKIYRYCGKHIEILES